MKAALNFCKLAIILSLLLSCSCATVHSPLPANVPVNKDAARGNVLTVTLRLKSGEELLFAVDTCAPCTLLDKSLEPKLGHRFDTVPVFEQMQDSKQTGGVSLTPKVYLGEAPLKFTNYIMWGTRKPCGVYLAPRLYLRDTPLKMTGNGILTCDLKSVALPGQPRIMGILGMDILGHYCIQLDFEAGKMRFLNPRHLNVADLGKAFPISFYSEDPEGEIAHPFIQQPGVLGGVVTNVFIDTGLRIDGTVNPELFQREIVQQRRQEGSAVHDDIGRVWFTKCVWNGETYTNLLIGPGGGAFAGGKNPNFIGLGFLARHLVTFDFPHRMMYLKQTSVGPLVDENMETAEAFLNDLKAKGELPGWSRNDIGAIYPDIKSLQIEFDGRKNGDPSDYHYQVGRLSRQNPWKLEKAWRTDQSDKAIEEFPVP
jgi:hypothetical protein